MDHGVILGQGPWLEAQVGDASGVGMVTKGVEHCSGLKQQGEGATLQSVAQSVADASHVYVSMSNALAFLFRELLQV